MFLQLSFLGEEEPCNCVCGGTGFGGAEKFVYFLQYLHFLCKCFPSYNVHAKLIFLLPLLWSAPSAYL